MGVKFFYGQIPVIRYITSIIKNLDKEKIERSFMTVRIFNLESNCFNIIMNSDVITIDDGTVFFVGTPVKNGVKHGCVNKLGYIPFDSKDSLNGLKVLVVEE